MAKVQLDIPDKLHLDVKRQQIERESKGEKINLKELYIELIRKALDQK